MQTSQETDSAHRPSEGKSSGGSGGSHSIRNAQRAARTLAEDFGDAVNLIDSTNASASSPAPSSRPSPSLPPSVVHAATHSSAASGSSSAASSSAAGSAASTMPSPSFTSDSPYLQSHIDREMRNLIVLTETLRDVSARARTFGKCGALMAEATRRLSSACRLNPPGSSSGSSGGGDGKGKRGSDGEDSAWEEQERVMNERRESVGDEMSSVLSVLGEILDEVADAQVSMCQSLEASLSLSLEAFAGVELNEATRLRSEADAMSDSAESSFGKYMHGRHSERANIAGGYDGNNGSGGGGGGGGGTIDILDQQNLAVSWNKLSDQLGSQLKQWSRTQSNESVEGLENGDGGGGEESSGGRGGRRGRRVKDQDPAQASAEAAANLRHNLEQIRLAQANAELKRFQLLRRLDSIKTRRNFELGESALASLNGIRAYFHHCSDMIEGLTPKLSRLQEKQAQSRERHDASQAPWDAKQKSLTNAISEVGVATANAGVIADAISRGHASELSQSMMADQPTSLDEIESNVKFWELPQQLSIAALYQRKKLPGVIVEGWLYKKSSNRLVMNSWSRRWFILDRTGVYYLKDVAEGKGGASKSQEAITSDYMERIKVCDILLCTVREINTKIKGNPNLRFCFEIISPNSRAYMLQACGPTDFKMWVEGIRSCIEEQLFHGNVPPDNMLIGGGKNQTKKNRNDAKSGSSESAIFDSDHTDNNSAVENRGSRGAGGQLFDQEPGDGHQSSSSCMRNPLVAQILHANPVCADCCNIDPDWASLNLGVLVCIECSGVHRSLGVHVSKVRSLRLDTMSEFEYNLLASLGNEKVNRVWESGLCHQKGWTKPEATAPRRTKEEWIKSKYQWKGFLEYRTEDGREQQDREAKFSRDLYESARRCDLFGVAEGLAKGGRVEWRNDEEGGKTALHICVVAQPLADSEGSWKGVECAELLIQNGAKLDVEDNDHHKALDCAVVGNGRREMIEYLSFRAGG